MNEFVIHILYVVPAALFVLSLKWMNSPVSARRSVFAGELGMLLAVVGTLPHHNVVSYDLSAIAFLVGAVAGVPLAVFMPMTAVPQRTALSHAFGALAAAWIATAEYYAKQPSDSVRVALVLETLPGYLTFTGSLKDRTSSI
jgi:NAD(P) transhydrogenase subunit beta